MKPSITGHNVVFSFETVCKFDIVARRKSQISCYQKLGIGGGFWSPEKISPKKFHKKRQKRIAINLVLPVSFH